jgi:hypothetical protein
VKEYVNTSREASSNLGDLLREGLENKTKTSLDPQEDTD